MSSGVVSQLTRITGPLFARSTAASALKTIPPKPFAQPPGVELGQAECALGNVRAESLDELADELDIAVDFLLDRIDDERLAATPAGEQIRIGAGNAVKELAENHRCGP